jgi:hypothetical protein
MNKWRYVLLMAVLLCGGCVERHLTVGSNPSGAILLLNDVEVGRTPTTVTFEWYGDYDVKLRLEKNVGTPEEPKIVRYYLHTHETTKTPWFQFIIIDLFAEILPIPFKDEQTWAMVVPEVQEPSDAQSIKDADDKLIKDARELKAEALKPPQK